MRRRGFAPVVVVLVGALSVAGCTASARGAPARAVGAASSGAAAPSTAVPTASRPPSGPPPDPAGRSPTPGGTRTVPGSAPPWCHLADLRFHAEAGIGGGSPVSGTVLLTNISGHRCALTGYLTLRWRDAHGAVLPVTVTHMNAPVPGVTIAIPPGATAFAAIYWDRYQTPDSTLTCSPLPATFDAWLPPTVENPHPEQGPPARAAWVTGESGSVCGGKVALRPVDIIR